MSSKTIFGDFRQVATAVYRVKTESSVYIVGFHHERGHKYVVVRGLSGTDREHVVLRDSDPRVGDTSMFELPPGAWVGQSMSVATMTSSRIIAVEMETDRAVIASVGGDSPSAQTGWMRQVSVGPVAAGGPHPPGAEATLGQGTRPGAAIASSAAYSLVVGQALPAAQGPTDSPQLGVAALPYPLRHVRYAERVALLLRSIARRDQLFEDVAEDRELSSLLTRSLDECADLLEVIRHRRRR